MELLVVGAGSMGHWFAESLAADGDTLDLYFFDRDPTQARTAADALEGTALEAVPDRTFDAVCIAVPIPAVEEAIERHAPHASGALIDVSGTMTTPLAAMQTSAPDLERVSIHPLFAPENAPGNVPVVLENSGPIADRIRRTLSDRGNNLFETTPTEHDEAMETVQASAHTAILAYALAAADVPAGFQTPISSELGSLVEQVTGGDARVYADIQTAFEGAERVAEAATAIAEADSETFESLYEAARSN